MLHQKTHMGQGKGKAVVMYGGNVEEVERWAPSCTYQLLMQKALALVQSGFSSEENAPWKCRQNRHYYVNLI